MHPSGSQARPCSLWVLSGSRCSTLGVRAHASTSATRVDVSLAPAAAILHAYVVFGLTFIVEFTRRMRWARARHPDMTPDMRWCPSFPRFWRFDLHRSNGGSGAHRGAQ